jgi:glutathione S-transferase
MAYNARSVSATIILNPSMQRVRAPTHKDSIEFRGALTAPITPKSRHFAVIARITQKSGDRMYTLYYSPGTASMVVHLALLEIGVPYRLELVDFEKDVQHSAEYLKLSPHGVVPTLVIDGKPMTESAALLMILAERHPEARLAPPIGTPEHQEWTQWIVYLSNTLASAYRLWFYPRDLGVAEHPPEIHDAIQRKIETVWNRLDAHLSAHGPYLLGDEFSGADLLLTMHMRWSRNMPRPVTEWPALKKLADLVRARASWKKLYEIEGLREW